MVKAIVISGPSGSGKTTLIKRILKDAELKDKLLFSVSCTTREKRPGEMENVDYKFVSREKFMDMITRDELLEWAEVHGNLYGTPRSNLEEAEKFGKTLILDVDVQGAKALREKLGDDCVLIFIKPPNLEEIKKRIIARSDTKDVERRLERANYEMSKVTEFDYVIINDDLQKAFEDLKAVIRKILGQK